MGGKTSALLAFLWLLAGCVKDTPNPATSTIPLSEQGIYTICEGLNNTTTGGLYFIAANNDSTYGDLFQSANSTNAGELFQSMASINNHLYMVMNESNKIVVIDRKTYLKTLEISVPAPRYICQVSDSVAYISSYLLKRTQVYVYRLNITTNTITDSIQFPFNNTDGMCVAQGRLLVACWDTMCNHVYVIDPNSNQITDSMSVAGRAPNSIFTDANQNIWVLSGNPVNRYQAYFTQIDPITHAQLKVLPFSTEAIPFRPTLNKTKDTIYYINADYFFNGAPNGVFRFGINETELPTTPLIPADKYHYFYALGIHPISGHIYIGDPMGWQQSGVVQEYNTLGQKLKTYKVGIGPNSFIFNF